MPDRSAEIPFQAGRNVLSKGMPRKPKFTFVDLFAGIGGFHQALHQLGGRCVMVCERDKFARRSYEAFHRKKLPANFFLTHDDELPGVWSFPDDIRKVTQSSNTDIGEPEWIKHISERVDRCDVVCAGFPCQPFSQAGKKKGFDDTRGTLFHDVARIIKAKQPKAFFLENVRGLISHDWSEAFGTVTESGYKVGRTLKVILEKLFGAEESGGLSYHPACDKSDGRMVTPGVFLVHASDHGLPQSRPRVFIIGFKSKAAAAAFKLPTMNSPKPRRLARLLGVSEVLMKGEKDENGNWPKRRVVGFTLRCGGKRSPVHDKRNWDQYYVIKKLRVKKSKKGVKYKKKKISINQIKVLPITWKHGLKLQGFPGRANLPAGVSSAQMMKQLGNSVAVPAIKAWGEKIAKAISKS